MTLPILPGGGFERPGFGARRRAPARVRAPDAPTARGGSGPDRNAVFGDQRWDRAQPVSRHLAVHEPRVGRYQPRVPRGWTELDLSGPEPRIRGGWRDCRDWRRSDQG